MQVPRYTFFVGFFLKPKLNKSFLYFRFDIHFKINLVLPQRIEPYVFVPSILQSICQDLSIAQQTVLVFQDVFKKSSRRLQRNTFRLPRPLQDVFAIRLPKTSSRRLQDIFKTCLQDVLQLYLQDVFKTSWKTNKCYTEDVLKTSSRCLQYVFTKTNVCWVNAKVSIVEKRMY